MLTKSMIHQCFWGIQTSGSLGSQSPAVRSATRSQAIKAIRTGPVETALLPVLQVPVMGVALWAESYWIAWPRADVAARRSEAKIVRNISGRRFAR